LLLQSSLERETEQRALRTIARNAEAQSQLIADVLDVSRIVSGKMRLSIQGADLARIGFDALDSVRPAADAKGIVLRSAIEPSSLWVSADPDRLQQILWNLLTNAIKFTPRGGEVRLEISCRANSSSWPPACSSAAPQRAQATPAVDLAQGPRHPASADWAAAQGDPAFNRTGMFGRRSELPSSRLRGRGTAPGRHRRCP
jgi:signal transduction histidine kinase